MVLREGSKLEHIGYRCFSGSKVDEFLAPRSLREIGSEAFARCQNLRRVVLNEGLEKLGDDITKLKVYRERPYLGVFEGSGIENVQLPSTLSILEGNTFKACRGLKYI